MLNIGNIKLEVPVILAPMADITNLPFRTICSKIANGKGLFVSEMVAAAAIARKIRKALKLLEFSSEEKIKSLQLFCTEPLTTYQAVEFIVQNYQIDHLDLNFGCPVPKVTKLGGGCATPYKLDLFSSIITNAIKAKGGKKLPITIKMRIGIDTDHITYLDSAKCAEQLGVSAITLHARTGSQLYTGTANWDYIKKLKESVSIPVIGNGDVICPQDYFDMIEQTNCDGVAIARGAVGRPWIFRDIAQKNLNPTINTSQIVSTIKEQTKLMVDWVKNEEQALKMIRKYYFFYFKGFSLGSETRTKLFSIDSLKKQEKVLDSIEEISIPAYISRSKIMNNRTQDPHLKQKVVKVPAGWYNSRSYFLN